MPGKRKNVEIAESPERMETRLSPEHKKSKQQLRDENKYLQRKLSQQGQDIKEMKEMMRQILKLQKAQTLKALKVEEVTDKELEKVAVKKTDSPPTEFKNLPQDQKGGLAYYVKYVLSGIKNVGSLAVSFIKLLAKGVSFFCSTLLSKINIGTGFVANPAVYVQGPLCVAAIGTTLFLLNFAYVSVVPSSWNRNIFVQLYGVLYYMVEQMLTLFKNYVVETLKYYGKEFSQWIGLTDLINDTVMIKTIVYEIVEILRNAGQTVVNVAKTAVDTTVEQMTSAASAVGGVTGALYGTTLGPLIAVARNAFVQNAQNGQYAIGDQPQQAQQQRPQLPQQRPQQSEDPKTQGVEVEEEDMDL